VTSVSGGSLLRLSETALLVFFPAAAWAWIVAANLVTRVGNCGGPVFIRLSRPTRRQYLIVWSGCGAALSQPQCDFHILFVARNRDINGFPPDRTSYHIDRLDSLEIDQCRYCEAVECWVGVAAPFQRLLENSNALAAARGMPPADFLDGGDCRGGGKGCARVI
jgi:hypothetical protein